MRIKTTESKFQKDIEQNTKWRSTSWIAKP